MADAERLQAELAELRQQLAAYRQREMDDLRVRLAAAEADALHYRAEAERNMKLGHQIHAEAQQEIQRLRSQLEAKESLSNVRVPAPGRPQ